MKKIIVLAGATASALLVGCGPSALPITHHAATPGSQPGTNHAATPAVTRMTDRQTCRYLRIDILRNGGTPRTKTLRYLAVRGPHWLFGLPGSPSLWEAAITDVRKDQTSRIRFDLTRFSAFCRPAGVQIPQG